ncbi:folylpolyglutamate synthase [Tulasnella sp. UAMH 9824]|nr:folylpolyglutamate synthase [Tulasnella sp. UAMH 9824]
MDLSLSRIRSLVALLPRYTRPTIHIAGTNGKGSTTALIDSILRQASLFTGRFNSPHLLDIHDSILLNGHEISPGEYYEALRSVTIANETGNCQCTSFELQTATALLAFERAGVEVVILEVGLGGRLDATNVISDDVVLVSGIAAIDLDHQAVLGDSLEQIAREKAAIARRGRPCVLGRQSHPVVMDAIKMSVGATGGYLLYASDHTQIFQRGPPTPVHPAIPPPASNVSIHLRGERIDTTIGLQGSHQMHNAELAVAIIGTLQHNPTFQHVTLQQISRGLSLARWPGRLDWISYRTEHGENLWLLADGAHNPASAASLARYLASLPISGPRCFVISLSYSPSKPPRSTLEAVLLPGDRVAVVPFSAVDRMPWVKPQEPALVVKVAKDLVGPSGDVVARSDLRAALSWARHNHSTVVVTGSLYLVADLYRLQLAFP